MTKEIHLGGLAAGFALTMFFRRFRQPVVIVGTAVVALALLCGLVVVRTPQIKVVDRELHAAAATMATISANEGLTGPWAVDGLELRG